ncbi:hypothetical protein GCM10020358_01500 [Amorphoplanes nipponensis]
MVAHQDPPRRRGGEAERRRGGEAQRRRGAEAERRKAERRKGGEAERQKGGKAEAAARTASHRETSEHSSAKPTPDRAPGHSGPPTVEAGPQAEPVSLAIAELSRSRNSSAGSR